MNGRSGKRLLRRIAGTALALVMAVSAGCLPALAAEGNPYAPTQTVTFEDITFGRATAAYNYTTTTGSGEEAQTVAVTVEGMPLFDGQEDHLSTYVALLLEEIGPEGWIALAAGGSAAGSYTDSQGAAHTYTIPSGTSTGGEALQGAAGQTELSTVMYQAQSWNKELIHDIGYLMGSENKSKQDNGGYNWTTSTGTSMTDMRLNPLSGRYDEGYGEDPVMASQFASLNSRGYNGYGMDETGMYIMANVNTKHYSVYNAQWFRPVASTQVGVRSFYEYNAYSANRGFSDGTISSFMSSYGRINGVPSSASFITAWANSLSPYGVYNGPDAGATTPYLTMEQSGDVTYGQWGNGYDEAYSPNAAYKAASLLAAGHRTSSEEDAAAAVEQGLNGVTAQSAYPLAKAYLTIRTRVGIYDEKDANGLSKYYPFNDIAANCSGKVDYTSASSQEVALRNAREGIVLLKNEGNVLPLSTGGELGIYGVFANAVNSGIYSVAVTGGYSQRGELAGNSPLEALKAKSTGGVDYDMGLNTVTIQTAGGYLYVEEDGAAVQIKPAASFEAAADKTGYHFAILDSGQDAYSIYSYGSGKWLKAIINDPTIDWDAIVGKTGPLPFHPTVEEGAPLVTADDACTFKQRPNQGLPPMLSGYPYHFTMESAGADGQYYIRAGAKVNGVTFITGVAPLMSKNYGYYLEVQDGQIGLGGAAVGDNSNTGAGLTYFNGLSDKSGVTFTVTEVEAAGSSAAANAAEDDCAIVFVGQSYLGLSGEGTDRLTLELGEGQIEEALNVAAAYKDAGKHTVAVVYANYPVVVEKLQQSAAVDAILFAGYGGQFGGRALAETVFGEYAPTGRLVSTWYKDLELFPALNEYSIPQGNDGLLVVANDQDGAGLGLEDIDSGITVDMSNADVIGAGLTYQYLTEDQTAAHVTYPFGYGLSYASFTFSNLKAPQSAGEPFDVTVDVRNDSSSVTTDEVVQLYMAKNGSAYGDAVPLKKLVSFEKVTLAPGETKTVTLTVDPAGIAVWDVNAEDYVVEEGAYTLWASDSSALTGGNTLKTTLNLTGAALAGLDIQAPVNVWEHSFAAENTYYTEYSKLITAASAVAEGVGDDIYAVGSRAAGAWTAIPKVDFTGVEQVTLHVASTGSKPSVELRLDSPDGQLVGTASFQPTGEVEQTLLANDPANAAVIHELGYVDASAGLSGASGVHDLYLVFTEKDTRVGTITFTAGETLPYADVSEGEWYYDAVQYMYKAGMMTGTAETTFSPTQIVDRATVVTMLYRLEGEPEAEVPAFPDVEAERWYTDAVGWASANGIVTGYDGGNFGPGDTITREQMAAILYRYAQTKGYDTGTAGTLEAFADAGSVAAYAADAMAWAVGSKLINGKSGDTLDPAGGASRAEVAAILMRFCENVK